MLIGNLLFSLTHAFQQHTHPHISGNIFQFQFAYQINGERKSLSRGSFPHPLLSTLLIHQLTEKVRKDTCHGQVPPISWASYLPLLWRCQPGLAMEHRSYSMYRLIKLSYGSPRTLLSRRAIATNKSQGYRYRWNYQCTRPTFPYKTLLKNMNTDTKN